MCILHYVVVSAIINGIVHLLAVRCQQNGKFYELKPILKCFIFRGILYITREIPGNALVILSFTDIFQANLFSAKVHTYYYAIKTYCSLK